MNRQMFMLLGKRARAARVVIAGLAVACALELAFVAAADAQEPIVMLPIAFHIVHVEGVPVVDRGFIERRLAQANRIYAPYGVGFSEQPGGVVPAEHADLDDRSARDALAAFVRSAVINCFVVRSLQDVDEPGKMRRGVHWHVQARAPTHFVILSAIAEPDVLAHELGHFLGNPEHSQTPGNLMSYQRGSGLPGLDRAQQRRVERAVCGYLRSGELRDLDATKARQRQRCRSHPDCPAPCHAETNARAGPMCRA